MYIVWIVQSSVIAIASLLLVDTPDAIDESICQETDARSWMLFVFRSGDQNEKNREGPFVKMRHEQATAFVARLWF